MRMRFRVVVSWRLARRALIDSKCEYPGRASEEESLIPVGMIDVTVFKS